MRELETPRGELLDLLNVIREYPQGERLFMQAVSEVIPQYRVSSLLVEMETRGDPDES